MLRYAQWYNIHLLGSERDVEAVTATFQNLGFEVRVLPNLKYGELNKAFNNVALREGEGTTNS